MSAGQRVNAGQREYGRTTLGLFALMLAVLFLKSAERVNEAILQGISLCVDTMIPSLFPFMVISELIVRTGIGRVMARSLVWLLRPLLGVGEGGACAVVMGVLCGFPVGAKTAADLYRAGHMDAREFQHVLCFCHLPSAAFLLGVVGSSLFGRADIGWMMLVLGLISTLAVGVIFRFLLPRRVQLDGDASECATVVRPSRHASVSMVPLAVSSAAGSMMGVCATVVLFSALVGVINEYAAVLSLGSGGRIALLGLLELSTGVGECAHAETVRGALVLCAAMLGWGGLSVHCQILAVCDGCPVSLGCFWLARALHAALMAGGAWLCLCMGFLDDWHLPLQTIVHETSAWPTVQNVNAGGLVGTAVMMAAVIWRWSRTRRERL